MGVDVVREVASSDKASVKRFVHLERQFVGGSPLFYSEPDADIARALSGRSSFFSETEHTLFVSAKGADRARCAAMINRRYQKAKNEAVGAIGYFAAAPDSGLQVTSMLRRAEAWLRERGVTRVVAPFNGVAMLGIGARTAAFDEPPMFPFAWQPPYYSEYLKNAGYSPSYPLWYYTVDFASDAYRAAARRVDERRGSFTIRPINKKKWRDDLEILRTLINKTFEDEWEFHPLERDELHEFFDPMKPILDPRQMLIAEVGGAPAGWCLGMPDWSPLFRSFKGKLGPLQILKLLLKSGQYQRAGLLGIGIGPEHRGTGLAQALAIALYRRYEERGLREALYYPVNEVNARSRKFAESMGGRGRALYHCYELKLS